MVSISVPKQELFKTVTVTLQMVESKLHWSLDKGNSKSHKSHELELCKHFQEFGNYLL